MRLAGLFAAKDGFAEGDMTGVTIDVITGLAAGLALIIGVWLLGGTLHAGIAPALAG